MSSTASKIFALVDCNNFYVSCERLFRPELKTKAVVVLSNNDACVISRSEEAKSLGIPMGAPFFELEKLIQEKKVFVFSSNYALYGDLSQRVMNTLATFTTDLEIYSIDEAFLSLEGIQDPYQYCHQIRLSVIKNTGIPVGVGLGPTKVLAKMANKLSKKSGGVCNLYDKTEREIILPKFPVENIWGIGARSTLKLHLHGIKTADDLRRADEKLIEKLLTITGKRIQLELKGISCLDLETDQEERQQVICSRGFGRPVTNRQELQEALSTYLTRASERLRNAKLQCAHLQVYLQTQQEKKNHSFRGRSFYFSTPTQELSILIDRSFSLLDQLYEKGELYVKAGVILTELSPLEETQLSIFERPSSREEKCVSQLMDQINQRFGRDKVKLASCGTSSSWALRSEYKSPAYTTRWNELLRIPLSF